MTTSDMDATEHRAGTATEDFGQNFPRLSVDSFPDAAKPEEFSAIMPAQSGEGPDEGEPQAEADNSAMIAGLPVMMKVVLGSAKMPVATLAKLAKGSVVRLDKMVGDPVDILVNGHLIARGEVVVLNESSSRFGVVLTQVGKLGPAGK